VKKPNLFDAFLNALKRNPESSRKEAFEAFLETVRSDPAYIVALADDYFYRMEAQWRNQQDARTGSYSVVATPAKQRRAEVAASKDRIAKAKEELAEKIRPFIWLEMEMPNGKKLRHCTGAELAQFGGAFLAISKELKPNQVVDKHLSEQDIRNIASRFRPGGGGKRRPSAQPELRA
jgi:hypothetical protein